MHAESYAPTPKSHRSPRHPVTAEDRPQVRTASSGLALLSNGPSEVPAALSEPSSAVDPSLWQRGLLSTAPERKTVQRATHGILPLSFSPRRGLPRTPGGLLNVDLSH